MKKYLSIIALVVVVVIGTQVFFAKSSQSQTITGGPVTGWLWSSTIGWVSMNCSNTSGCASSNYGVSVDAVSGAMSGYAWSSNIGWIKFGGLSGYPVHVDATTGNAIMNFNTGAVTGWARACSGALDPVACTGDRTDGWDGWISLSGTNYASPDIGDDMAGVTLDPDTGSIRGKAWGGSVVGWLDFDTMCAGCTDSGIVNDVVVTGCTVNPPSPAAPGNRTFTATATGGNGTFTYRWNGGVFGASATSDPIYYSASAEGATVTARSNGLNSENYQCPNVTVTAVTAPLKLFIGFNQDQLAGLTGASPGFEQVTITRGQPISLRWINGLAPDYTSCSAQVTLPNGTTDNSQTVWPTWPAGADNMFLSTGTINLPTTVTTPTGSHNFTISCTNGTAVSSTARANIRLTIITDF